MPDYIIGRHINGITVNPMEYVLDVFGEIKRFSSENEAKIFLKNNGLSDEDIYNLQIIEA